MHKQLNKYFIDELSLQEKDELFDQINSSEEEKKEYARAQISVALSSMLHQEGDEAWSSRKLEELQNRIRVRRIHSFLIHTLKYAAVVAIAVIGTWVGLQYSELNDKSGMLIDVPKGQRVHLTFADGTTAWLSPRTKLRVPDQFSKKNRIVELDGEGYFSVTKDAKHPFIVQTKKYDVKVLGTKFNVFAYSESSRFETDLVEGSVHVYDPRNQDNSVTLIPNEKAYIESGKLIKTDYIFTNEEYLKNGIFCFTDIPFSEILSNLSLWYDVKFEYRTKTPLNYKISGKFRQSDDIKDILKALQGVHLFNYKIENDHIIKIY